MGSGTWLGILAPAKTPKAIVNKLHDQIVAALNTPELRKAFEERVIQPIGNTPEEFARHIQTETAQWKQLVAKVGLKPE
jgi:tripartite-type tricarboxylate transporter receptor subunit TctC